jgi:hypothetical protein
MCGSFCFFVERSPWFAPSALSHAEALPPIETVAPGTLTPADGESHDPQNQQDDRSNPQQMYGESGTEEDQDEQQCENEQHETRLLSIDSQDPR